MNKKGGSIGVMIGIVVLIIILLVAYALVNDKSTIGGSDEPIIPTSVTTDGSVVTTLEKSIDNSAEVQADIAKLSEEQQAAVHEFRNADSVEECEGIALRDECLVKLAETNQDSTICKRINEEYYKKICLENS